MSVGRRLPSPRLVLHVSPVELEMEARPRRVAALVLVVEPDRQPVIDADLVASALGGPLVRGTGSPAARDAGTGRRHGPAVSRRRAASRVRVSFSRGTPVTNGRTTTPSRNGMPRVRVIDSHCMRVPSSRSSNEQ